MERDNIIVCIRDTGIGMSEETMNKIFEPFFTTRDIGEGKGLGLSISPGIIEKHNEKIEVESQEEYGATFIISLPVN